MLYRPTLPAVILLITAGILSISMWLAWRRRAAAGGRALFWLTWAGLVWCLGAGLEAASTSLGSNLFWAKVESLGQSSGTPLLLLFSLRYSRRTQYLTLRNLLALWTLPAATILLTLTNEWHHLRWTAIQQVPGSDVYLYQGGPVYWVYVAYSYFFALASIYVFFLEYVRAGGVYRQQIGTIIFGMVFPFVISIFYVLGLDPIPGLDITAISFAVSGIIFTWSFTHYRLMDLVPIAREMLIEHMQDGVLVIDHRNRLLDVNRSARRTLGLAEDPIGLELFSALAKWPILASAILQKPRMPFEATLAGHPPRFLDVRVESIASLHGEPPGYVVLLRDITDRKKIEDELRERSEELAMLAITDELTGLYNRRHVNQLLEVEFQRSERYGTPLAIATFDIDGFKQINDSFGHPQGDQTLRAVAAELLDSLRSTDIAARVGGDEFLVLLPHTDLEQGWLVMERLRRRVNELPHPAQDGTCRLTLSAGVTAWFHADSPEAALKRVDGLLYRAKEAGKNLVVKDA
jgi:diguanylate cyclase (GGDEF)-like protein